VYSPTDAPQSFTWPLTTTTNRHNRLVNYRQPPLIQWTGCLHWPKTIDQLFHINSNLTGAKQYTVLYWLLVKHSLVETTYHIKTIDCPGSQTGCVQFNSVAYDPLATTGNHSINQHVSDAPPTDPEIYITTGNRHSPWKYNRLLMVLEKAQDNESLFTLCLKEWSTAEVRSEEM